MTNKSGKQMLEEVEYKRKRVKFDGKTRDRYIETFSGENKDYTNFIEFDLDRETITVGEFTSDNEYWIQPKEITMWELEAMVKIAKKYGWLDDE